MKSVYIILITIALIFILITTYLQKVDYTKLESQLELVTTERDIAHKYLRVYHQIQPIHIHKTSSIKDKDGIMVNIKSILDRKRKVVLWFSIESCQTCYANELELLKQHMADAEYDNNILIFVSGFENTRTFQYFINEQNLSKHTFSVDKTIFTPNVIMDNNIPFITVVDSNLVIQNTILLDKHIPSKITNYSIENVLKLCKNEP